MLTFLVDVLDDFNVGHRDQTLSDHLVQCGKKALDIFFGVDDLDQDWSF